MRTERFGYHQAGMSLIEVMVAVFILGTGLLGLAALQARSLAYAQSSFYRSIAADLAADLADRIRANRPPFFALDDSTPPVRPSTTELAKVPNWSTCNQTNINTSCPTDFNVKNDMTSWNNALVAQMPIGTTWVFSNPTKVVAPDQTPSAVADADAMGWQYTLTITWPDDRSGGQASYVTVIR